MSGPGGSGQSANDAPVEGRPQATAEDVVDYLRRHPNFLIDHPELLGVITPPAVRSEAGGIVDLQKFMVQRLQRRVTQLAATQDELIAAGRTNMSISGQVHHAVLALLEATSFEHLIHTVTHDFATILDVDVAVLLIEESDFARPHAAGNNLYGVRKGAVDRLLGRGRDILLRERSEATETIYGPASALVRSDALARLRFAANAPPGMLALGSREASKFHPGQATELLQFLARAVERCVRAWLDLPPT